MNSYLKGTIVFSVGALTGFAAGWFFSKCKYEKEADEAIDEVKRYYIKKEIDSKYKEAQEKVDEIINENIEHEDIIEKVKNKYRDVEKIKIGSDEEVKAEKESPEEDLPTKPYIITEEEFIDDNNDYEKLSLTYFAMDDTLADDCDEMVDIEETISTDIFNQISESDDGDYYVRNDTIRTDYEIMKVDQSYKERYGFDY